MNVMNVLLSEAQVIPVDEAIAEKFGQIRAKMFDTGLVVATSDLLIAVTALHLDCTVVTHNTRHFSMVPDMRLDDWL
jgi:tRNA(fMet)-specific endonuclease VapC